MRGSAAGNERQGARLQTKRELERTRVPCIQGCPASLIPLLAREWSRPLGSPALESESNIPM